MDSLEAVDVWAYEKLAKKDGHLIIAGIDEAGRGPLAGPVVAAAVVLPDNFEVDEIRDSKLMSSALRDKMFDKIICEALGVGVGIISPDIIDAINILNATHAAMKEAVNKLTIKCDYALVDGLPVKGLPIPHKAIVKGDSMSVSIGAASIIAKVTRDRIMIELHEKFPEYDFAAHKGYGTKKHLIALEKHGPCEHHRKSFTPVSERLMQCRLPGFD